MNEQIENHGVRPDPRPIELVAQDQMLGVDSPIVLTHKISYDTKYIPNGEPQSIPGVYDDMSCVSHSGLSELAHTMTYFYQNKLYRPENLKFLEDEGYVGPDGKIRFSTVFCAITNGTTNQGNYFHKFWDCARSIGIIPYTDLPSHVYNTWDKNHDGKRVTEAMRAKARRFINRFEIRYANLPTDISTGVNKVEDEAIKYYQQYAPIQIGYPIPSQHAIVQMQKKDNYLNILETYVPFYRTKKADTYPVNFYIFGYPIERPKVLDTVPPLKRLLKIGMTGADVTQLQANLRKLGYFSFPKNTEYFGLITLASVTNFQRDNGIIQTGNYGDLTHAKLYKLLNK